MMHKGTLIEELIAAVERVERDVDTERVHVVKSAQKYETYPAFFYRMQFMDQALIGVA